MIHLTKGQKLVDNPSIVVYEPTGYYNDGDSIICAAEIAPDEPICRYEAKFIAFGGMVYSITNSDELLTEIKKIDPETLFGKDSAVLAQERKIEEILAQEPLEEVPPVEPPVDPAPVDPPVEPPPVAPPVEPAPIDPPVELTPEEGVAILKTEVVEKVSLSNTTTTPEM